MKGAFLLGQQFVENVYGPELIDRIRKQVEIVGFFDRATYQTEASKFADVEVIFSGWGVPCMDADFLSIFPKLRAVFYAAGSIKHFVTPEFWDRGIVVTCSASANALPVTEFTLSQILFCQKKGWQNVFSIRQRHLYPNPMILGPGNYGSTVGLVSLGQIGRLVARRLSMFDIRVLAYDPYIQPGVAEELGVSLCSLEELFATADTVSCHAPWTSETENLLTYELFAQMKHDASFINTSRGAVVDEDGLVRALRERSDLLAVLDVTHPEPPVAGSPLYSLPNIILTPHIAGSHGLECRRMGELMAQEFERFTSGTPLRHQVNEQQCLLMA